MASIVDLVRPNAAFDPETIAVLSAALDEAWNRLLQSGSECTRPAYARAMREAVARRIIDMAQRGTRDQKELANGALRFLAANYRLERRRRQGSSGTAVARNPIAIAGRPREMRSVLRSNDTVANGFDQPIKQSTANEPQSQARRYEGHDRAASLVQFISIAALFHGCWHPRNRHERLRYLIEQLSCILFFAQ